MERVVPVSQQMVLTMVFEDGSQVTQTWLHGVDRDVLRRFLGNPDRSVIMNAEEVRQATPIWLSMVKDEGGQTQ